MKRSSKMENVLIAFVGDCARQNKYSPVSANANDSRALLSGVAANSISIAETYATNTRQIHFDCVSDESIITLVDSHLAVHSTALIEPSLRTQPLIQRVHHIAAI